MQDNDRIQIPELNGLRVIFIFLVANFHIWQQSWLPQYIKIGKYSIGTDFIARSGYIFVDAMVLISAFLIFLPYAKNIFYGSALPSLSEYYTKKAARILPSYYFNVVLLFFLLRLPMGGYWDDSFKYIDFFTHISLTQTYHISTYVGTRLNPGLWTIVIIMQAYIIMPFIIPRLIKRPVLVSIIMLAIAFVYRYIVYFYIPDTNIFVNRLFAFFDVYLLGFAACYIYVYLVKKSFYKNLSFVQRIFASLVFFLAIAAIIPLLKIQASSSGSAEIRQNQLALRFAFSLVICFIILSAPAAIRPIRFLLSNKLMGFLSAISYNFYIWHQVISSELRINFYNTDQLHSDLPLQIAFTILCYSFSLCVSMLAYYGVEKPCYNFILNIYRRYKDDRSKNAKIS